MDRGHKSLDTLITFVPCVFDSQPLHNPGSQCSKMMDVEHAHMVDWEVYEETGETD